VGGRASENLSEKYFFIAKMKNALAKEKPP